MKVYLAGPISGKSFDEVVGRYNEKRMYLEDFGYEVLSPMTAKGGLRNIQDFGSTQEHYPASPFATNHAIFARDKWMVAQADIVIADLSNSGDRISIGTMMEIAWANYLNKQIVLIMGTDNLHYHAFVLEAATIILPTWDDARDYLKALAEGAL